MTDPSRIKKSALTLLARREYGADELKQHLLTKGYEPEIIENVIQELIIAGFQSDQRFVASYIRQRMIKGFGPEHITQALQEWNISSELIKEHLASYQQQWADVLRTIAQKKFGGMTLSKEMKIRTKQIRYLMSRGFTISEINQYLIKEQS